MSNNHIVRALTKLEGRTVQVISKSHNRDGSELNDHLCMVIGQLKYSEPTDKWVIDNHNSFIRFSVDDVTKVVVSDEGNSVVFIYWNPTLFGGPFLR